jgi:hypothetical protein
MLFALIAVARAEPAEVAEPVPEGRPIVYKLREEIEFDGVELEATVVKPSITLTTGTPPVRFHPLIELRKDWLDEMRASIVNVE